MFTRTFWKKTAERSLKTAAQFGVVSLGTVVFTSVDQVVNAGTFVGLAILFGGASSVLTSIASAGVGPEGSPSVVE